MVVQLYPHQQKAVDEMHNGCVLWGGVGTGKTITALSYFVTKVCKGTYNDWGSMREPKDLYIITTAKKRDSLDWDAEAVKLGIGTRRDGSMEGILMTVDSWNNIAKYEEVKNAFFILDEQRLVGSGAWVKTFIKIARHNQWVLLSATPGDTWIDYIPVFVANGWYKNRTEFKRRHCAYTYFGKYPKLDHYMDVGHLVRLRNKILIHMPYVMESVRISKDVIVDYDQQLFLRVVKDRWHVYENRPIRDVAELFRVMRKVVNTDVTRPAALRELMMTHPRLIVFYNFDYELDILRTLGMNCKSVTDPLEVFGWTTEDQEKHLGKPRLCSTCSSTLLAISSSSDSNSSLTRDEILSTTSDPSERVGESQRNSQSQPRRVFTESSDVESSSSSSMRPSTTTRHSRTGSTTAMYSIEPSILSAAVITAHTAELIDRPSQENEACSIHSQKHNNSWLSTFLREEHWSGGSPENWDHISCSSQRSNSRTLTTPRSENEQKKSSSTCGNSRDLATTSETISWDSLASSKAKNDPTSSPASSVCIGSMTVPSSRKLSESGTSANTVPTVTESDLSETSLLGNPGQENCHQPANDGNTTAPSLESAISQIEHQSVQVAEWNGHKHEPIPTTDRWVYLVQYVAGAEGWNCVETNAMVFYSQTYSYRNWHQAHGRIDRLNTPYGVLYYYNLVSKSIIDREIKKSLRLKKNFNENSVQFG